jgi:hypothetical protein
VSNEREDILVISGNRAKQTELEKGKERYIRIVCEERGRK